MSTRSGLVLTWGARKFESRRFALWAVKHDRSYPFGFAVLARWEMEILNHSLRSFPKRKPSGNGSGK